MPLFGKRQVEARVTWVTWSRVVQLERQEWVAKRSTWDPAFRDDVRDVHRHTETYWDTVTDTQPGTPGANGIPGPPTTSTRMEMRTRNYYTYEALEWHRSAAPQASGTSQDGVAWPAYELGPGERVSDRKETYSASFTAGDKSYKATLPEQEWRALAPGASCHLTLSLLGGVKKVTPAGG
jgi:hypothetical protein